VRADGTILSRLRAVLRPWYGWTLTERRLVAGLLLFAALALAGHAAASVAATLLAVRAGAVEWHTDWTAAGPALAVAPLALAWERPRVTPAPSPMAKMFLCSVSSSLVRTTLEL